MKGNKTKNIFKLILLLLIVVSIGMCSMQILNYVHINIWAVRTIGALITAVATIVIQDLFFKNNRK